MKELTKKCTGCNGSGETGGTKLDENNYPVPSDEPCIKCSGSGVLPLGELSSDLTDLFSNMNDKVNDIFEKVNE